MTIINGYPAVAGDRSTGVARGVGLRLWKQVQIQFEGLYLNLDRGAHFETHWRSFFENFLVLRRACGSPRAERPALRHGAQDRRLRTLQILCIERGREPGYRPSQRGYLRTAHHDHLGDVSPVKGYLLLEQGSLPALGPNLVRKRFELLCSQNQRRQIKSEGSFNVPRSGLAGIALPVRAIAPDDQAAINEQAR